MLSKDTKYFGGRIIEPQETSNQKSILIEKLTEQKSCQNESDKSYRQL